MTKLIVVIGFVVAFSAGWMIAGAVRPAAHKPPPENRRGGAGSWIAEQLKLSPDQQKQMDALWGDTMRRWGRDSDSRRNEFRKQREEAILSLVRPEDRAAYDRIQKDYRDKTEAMEAEWRQTFERINEETKKILTPEQWEKFQEINKRGPRGRSSTRPATNPQ